MKKLIIEWSDTQYPILQTIVKSKWTDLALIASCAALLIIGILVSTGVLNFIGSTNAAYFSYGMYGGAGILIIAELIKTIVSCCHPYKKTSLSPISAEEAQILREKTPNHDPDDQKFRNETAKLMREGGLIDGLSDAEINNLQVAAQQLPEDIKIQALSIINCDAFKNNPTGYLNDWEKQIKSNTSSKISDLAVIKFLRDENLNL